MVSGDEYYTIPGHEVLVARLVLEIGNISQWDRNDHVIESRSRVILKNLQGPTRPPEQNFGYTFLAHVHLPVAAWSSRIFSRKMHGFSGKKGFVDVR